MAWDTPETKSSYAAYRLGALRWLVGGVGSLALSIGLSAYAVLVLKRPGLGVFIVAAVILGVLGLVTGVGGLIRAAQFRAALQQAPWRHAELRVAGAHLRLVFAGEGAETDDGSHAVDVRLMTTSRWRVRAVVDYRGGQVLICPVKDASFVLSAPGLHNLYGLLPLKRRAGHR